MNRKAFWLLAVAVAGCSPRDPSASSQGLVVVAPASLRAEFEAIAAAYKARNPGATVSLTFGNAAELAASGVPIDVIAADAGDGLDPLSAKLAAGERRFYAVNPLCLVTRTGAADVRLNTLTVSPWIQKLGIADSRVEGSGMAAEAALGRLGVRHLIHNQLKYFANGAQVLEKVAKGEIDAGLVYASEIAAYAEPKAVHIADRVPDDKRGRYPIAVLATSRQLPAARGFIDEVLHGEGRAAMAKKGLLSPELKP